MTQKQTADKHVATRAPVHALLADRWSPRAFTDRVVPREVVLSMIEAARIAPSCFNEQPWRYIVGLRQEPEQYERVLGCLVPWNQAWAKAAPLLMISVGALAFRRNGKPNKHAFHDIGLASMSMVVQAAAHGLTTHQMGGIDVEKIKTTFQIPEGYEPLTAFSAGYLGDPGTLGSDYLDDELAPRGRRPLEETFFGSSWGVPSSVLR